MKINVIIPTYNRANLLRETLQSIKDSRLPDDLKVTVTVVNNNSTDETEKVFRDFAAEPGNFEWLYLFEKKQGRSAAVNLGITKSVGDLVSMVDDDIQITKDWFEVIYAMFRNRGNEIDFIGGRVLPNWEVEPPSWVEPLKRGVISLRDYGEDEWFYSKETPMLSGGHAVFKTSVYKTVGLYPEELGTTGRSLMSCEDDVFYERLIGSGKKGVYCPDLKVLHFVPKYRLSKSYYRQWCFSAGMSWHLMDQNYGHFTATKLLGVPRYLYRDALLDLLQAFWNRLTGNETGSLEAERTIWIFAGFFYSRNLRETMVGKMLKRVVDRTITIAER
jgi:glycosyltransferase involved in cell wall biosynthesis